MAQTVVVNGLNSPYYLTNGYGPAKAISISMSPYAPVVATSSSTTITVNIAANWSLVGGGTLTAAPDGLSAVYTAPAGATTATVTVVDRTDPGNTQSGPINVTGFGSLTQGDFVPPGPAGRSIIGN